MTNLVKVCVFLRFVLDIRSSCTRKPIPFTVGFCEIYGGGYNRVSMAGDLGPLWAHNCLCGDIMAGARWRCGGVVSGVFRYAGVILYFSGAGRQAVILIERNICTSHTSPHDILSRAHALGQQLPWQPNPQTARKVGG